MMTPENRSIIKSLKDMATKVTLRQRELKSGKITLYLDYYPPVRDPRTREYVRHDYLGIYLVKNPREGYEKRANKEKLLQAEAIRAEREVSLMRGQYGFLDKNVRKMDFLEYFRNQLPDHDQKWMRVYDHFFLYCKGRCLMSEVTVQFCDGFRKYLMEARQLRNGDKALMRNSAAGYWNTFRALLKIAYRDKYLTENLNDDLERIETIESRRQFLTFDELKALAATPCREPVLKAASLFSCLTGLRISDILELRWENIQKSPDGGWCIRFRSEKTDAESTLPISDETYLLCGEPGEGLVFKGLTRQMTQHKLQTWLKEAGIDGKRITFHCFRHTFATLQVASGTDIYTVQHMLSHANVSTTQIYADIMDSGKRKAAERLSLDGINKE